MVCVGKKMCLEYDFLAVHEMDKMDGIISDGVLGLSPTKKDGNPILLDKLKQAGLIDKRQFAFKLGGGSPSLTFGNVEGMMQKFGRNIDPKTEIEWHPMQNDFNWSVPL